MTIQQPKPTLRRGEVVLVLFPNSDLLSAKTRPALIVQRDDLQTGFTQVIVAMISSRVSRAGHPSRVAILLDSPEGRQSGLVTDSAVFTDNLATVQDAAISQVIGSLPMTKIDQALRHTLNV